MPSASAKLEKQMSTESSDPLKQIVTIVEKKVRNLEKRKGKLDSYRHDFQNGKELNEDQKKAVEKYDQVVELLDFAKDLQKQFHTVVQENTKVQRKVAKQEKLERQQVELQRVKEIMVYQDLLNSMGGEDVRQDFLEGNKGAVKLTEVELNSLDELYKILCPERDAEAENPSEFDTVLTASAEHIQALLEAKNKEVFGTTYKALRETLQKILRCRYFSSGEEPEEQSNPEEKEAFTTEPAGDSNVSEADDFVMISKSDDFVMVHHAGGTPPQTEPPYFPPVENSSLYTEKTRPIQEVLSGQGNLNFLQESQIEVAEAQHAAPAHSTTPYGNVQFTPSQPLSASTYVGRTRQLSEGASIPPPVASVIPPPPGLAPTQAIDLETGRPINSQTFTNQSFHPMMAMAPKYIPSIPTGHVLPQNMVHSQLPQRPMQAHTMQLNMENSQPTHISSQYESNPIQESSVNKHESSYGNGSGSHVPVQDRPGNNTFSRAANQVDFGNERAYQSANKSQAYINRESFADTLSYSSNLKRGLTSRGGARGAGSTRGSSNNPRGGRVPYQN